MTFNQKTPLRRLAVTVESIQGQFKWVVIESFEDATNDTSQWSKVAVSDESFSSFEIALNIGVEHLKKIAQ